MASKVIYQISYTKKQEIWSIEEVKNYLRVSHDYDDKMISSLIDAAISEAENFTGLTLKEKKITILITSAQQVIKLKYFPLFRILSIYQHNNLEEDIKNQIGYVDVERARILLDKKFIGENLQVEYLSGYGDEIPIPRTISHGILLRVAAMYDRADDYGIIDKEIKNLYLPFRPFKI